MNPEEVEPDDFSIVGDEGIEVVDPIEVAREPQSDTGGSPQGQLQARIVKHRAPEGSEQGEDRWFKGQLVRRPWDRR